MDINILMKETSKIYDCLEDRLSKKIFCDRLLYSFTGDENNIFRIIQYIPEIKKFIKKLNDVDASLPKYIYGAGIRGRGLRKIWPYDWKGFIDRNEDLVGTEIDGIPVISRQSLKDRKDIVIVISNRFFSDEIIDTLLDLGIEKENIFNLSEVWNELIYKQYFDLPELTHSKDEVFVDDGAFDGLSTIQFIKWSENNFKKVYIWEPDQCNMQICINRLTDIISKEKCSFINKASWDMKSFISFTENGISSGVDENGEKTVESSTIACELQNADIPTFIKMDIEGSEGKSLCGCGELIKQHRPKLAISVYHKAEDIFDLPKLILSFNSDYKLYLRHYSCADWDTVLYAVPR